MQVRPASGPYGNQSIPYVRENERSEHVKEEPTMGSLERFMLVFVPGVGLNPQVREKRELLGSPIFLSTLVV